MSARFFTRKPRLRSSSFIDELAGKCIRVVHENDLGDGGFIGRCEVMRRSVDDLVRIKIHIPAGVLPPAYRYHKIGWIEIEESELESISAIPDNVDFDFEFNKPKKEK